MRSHTAVIVAVTAFLSFALPLPCAHDFRQLTTDNNATTERDLRKWIPHSVITRAGAEDDRC